MTNQLLKAYAVGVIASLIACAPKNNEPLAPVVDKEQIKKKSRPRKMNLRLCTMVAK